MTAGSDYWGDFPPFKQLYDAIFKTVREVCGGCSPRPLPLTYTWILVALSTWTYELAGPTRRRTVRSRSPDRSGKGTVLTLTARRYEVASEVTEFSVCVRRKRTNTCRKLQCDRECFTDNLGQHFSNLASLQNPNP